MNYHHNINNNNSRSEDFGFINPGGLQMQMQRQTQMQSPMQLQMDTQTQMQTRMQMPMQTQTQMQTPMQMQIPVNHNQWRPTNLLSQSQPQGRTYFPGHFQLSQSQTQSFVQDRTSQPQIMPQSQSNVHVSISSPSLSTPGFGTANRLQRPPSRPYRGPGQDSGSPMNAMELNPAAYKGKRKLPDKVVPDKVVAMLPESALYTQLLEFESRVDAALVRKKIDIVEALKNPMRAQKVLRVYIFNTYANQTGTNIPEKENAEPPSWSVEPPSWSLRIIGRILEDGKDPGLDGVGQNGGSTCPKFSSFFKKITVYLDESLYPDDHVILWESDRSPVLHDGFEVKRKGDKEFTAVVRLEMNYSPEKFRLSPALQEVLGIEVETRARIMASLWHYVKMRRLQIPGDSSSFMCDPPLWRVFGEEKLKFSMVNQKITPHLAPPGHIHLEHKIKLSGGTPAGSSCYDVLVDVPLLLEKEMSTFLANLEKNKEIDTCDEAISSALKKIQEHRRRRAFFLGFSQSPVQFINTLTASQATDLKLVSGDASRDVEKERQAEFYNQPWTEDAVIRYLNRKSAVVSEAARKR